ncbi:MAG: hypothetical protein EBT86_01030 [Actinobacteria bacterium]|nr:hypothetical protein [Actinomycetota bacterium]
MPPKKQDSPKCLQQIPIKTQIELSRVSKEKAVEILEELWYQYAERLIKKVSDVCNLDEEQRVALKAVALRPNDFVVEENS